MTTTVPQVLLVNNSQHYAPAIARPLLSTTLSSYCIYCLSILSTDLSQLLLVSSSTTLLYLVLAYFGQPLPLPRLHSPAQDPRCSRVERRNGRV